MRLWVNGQAFAGGDDDNVRELELPATGQHTLAIGLTRMLLGYAMEAPGASGSRFATLMTNQRSDCRAGRASGFAVDAAISGGAVWRRSDRWWLPVCRDMLNDFFLPDADTEAAAAVIEREWQAIIAEGVAKRNMATRCRFATADELAQRHRIRNVLASAAAGPTSMTGNADADAFHSVQVVCLLGMNDGVCARASLRRWALT